MVGGGRFPILNSERSKEACHPARLQSWVERLAEFPSRHSLTSHAHDAAAYLRDTFAGFGLESEIWSPIVPAGPRVPEPVAMPQVLARLPGRTDRWVMVGAHFDSLNLVGTDGPTDVERVKANRAPGANDNASGVSVVLACAQALAGEIRECGVLFVAFSGEEQGLLGAKALAAKAKEEGWKLEAFLNLDTVGSSGNLSGLRDDRTVRVFSEEAPHHQSRELARWIEWKARQVADGQRVRLAFRKDRLRRGGDHSPFNDAGFSAVRFVEPHEEYSRQHTPDDLPEHMDFEYLSRTARLVSALLSELASAPEPVVSPKVVLDQKPGVRVAWEEDGPVEIFWRDTTSPVWEGCTPADQSPLDLSGLDKDMVVVGVARPGGWPTIAD